MKKKDNLFINKKIICIVFLLLALSFVFAFAQQIEDFPVNSDESLFADDSLFLDDDLFSDSMIEEVIPSESQKKSSSVTVSTDSLGIVFEAGSVRFGGSMTTSTDLSVVFANPYTKKNDVKKYIGDSFENTLLIPTISAFLFFDARPKENLRLYGKLKIDSPLPKEYYILSPSLNQSGVLVGTSVGSITFPSISIFELFTDFSWNDRVFFRFGKHTVNWGVGYFFSPADIINLGSIDPQKPENLREGPVSLRSQIIFPRTQNNLWLYVLPDTTNFQARYTAGAGKFEFLVGNYEFGVGLWYKYGRSPRLSLTTSGSIKKISVFAEGVLAYGTENQWENVTQKSSENIYSQMWAITQATIGASYTWKLPKISTSFQYFYNGFGSFDPLSLSQSDFMSLKKYYGYVGQHYIAVSLSKSELFTRKLTASAFTLISPLGFSGMASGTLTFAFMDTCSMSFGPTFTFGITGGEFSRRNGIIGDNSIACTLSFKLGGGKF